MQKIEKSHFSVIVELYSERVCMNIKYGSFFTGTNDAVDTIVGFLLAPSIDGVRGFLVFREVYRLYVGTIVRFEILFVLRFYWEIFVDE